MTRVSKKGKKIGRPGKPIIVRDVVTGETKQFASFRDAEKALGIDRRRIHTATIRNTQIDGLEFYPTDAWKIRGERVGLNMKFAPPQMELIRTLSKWLGIKQREFMERAVDYYGEYINAQKLENEKQQKALEHGARDTV